MDFFHSQVVVLVSSETLSLASAFFRSSRSSFVNSLWSWSRSRVFSRGRSRSRSLSRSLRRSLSRSLSRSLRSSRYRSRGLSSRFFLLSTTASRFFSLVLESLPLSFSKRKKSKIFDISFLSQSYELHGKSRKKIGLRSPGSRSKLNQCVVFSKSFLSFSASLYPGVHMGTGELSGKPDQILEEGGLVLTLRWTRIPSRVD